MSKAKLPTVAELAKLAALVYPHCREIERENPKQPGLGMTSSREEQSVMLASRLWLRAAMQLTKLADVAASPDKSAIWTAAGDSAEMQREKIAAYFEGCLNPSQAVEWLRTQPPMFKQGKLTLKSFQQAWEGFGGPKLGISEPSLREFVRSRIVPWKKAVMLITRKSDESKATAAFRSYYAEVDWKTGDKPSDPDELRRAIAERIANWKRVGMTAGKVEYHSEEYRSMPRRGQRLQKKDTK